MKRLPGFTPALAAKRTSTSDLRQTDRSMIIANVFGGLGNQMFQYAAARAIATRHRCPLLVDCSDAVLSRHEMHNGFELARIFNLHTTEADDKDIRRVIGPQWSFHLRRLVRRPGMSWFRPANLVVEPHFHYWHGIHTVNPPCYLHGYWQSDSYFADIADQVRNDFTFSLQLSAENQAWLDRMQSGYSVGVHIRRGDYVRNPRTNRFHGTLSADYYARALRYIMQRVGSVELFVFSDDIPWVKKNLAFNATTHYVACNQGTDSYVDMYLMSNCAHNVIANSTFSWWAGWLNRSSNKIVVAPTRWFADEAINSTTLYPTQFSVL